MTAVDIFKASRMKQIEDTTVVSGLVDSSGHLLLSTRAGENIDAGNVIGPMGPGFQNRGAWAANTDYNVRDVVTSNGSTFVVLTAHTSSTTAPTASVPGSNLAVWAQKGIDGTGYTYRGAWAPSTAYAALDVVTSGGSTFLVTTAHTSSTTAPTPAAPGANLSLWAQKGIDGSIGVDGSPAVPAGTISLWGSDTPPANWMICDGAAISRTTYASLFAAIGTRYGAGDGVNTFNLPNLKGRTPVGKDAAQTEFAALAQNGGEKTHLQTVAEMPSHQHMTKINISTINTRTAGSNTFNVDNAGNDVTTATGGGAPFNVLQPYTVVNFIIKVTNGDTAGDSQLTQRVSNLETFASASPAGTITIFGGDTAPTNWMFCDGSAISRTTYASLFAAIGTKYGAGDGTTTFNLPNLKGRSPFGLDATQTEFNVLGLTGGTKTHTHVHMSPIGLSSGTAYIIDPASASMDKDGSTYDIRNIDNPVARMFNSGALTSGALEIHKVTSSPSGTLPPYLTVNYIIKVTNGDTQGDSQLTGRVSAIESGTVYSTRFRDKMAALKRIMTGGGQRKVSSTGVSWSERFIMLGSGTDEFTPLGYIGFSMPPNGTVIPVHDRPVGQPNQTSATVAAGVIPMDDWCGLYYEFTPGEPVAGSTKFHIVDYRVNQGTVIPPNWILVVAKNLDQWSPLYTWGDGRSQDPWRSITLLNSWTQFSNYSIAGWRWKDDGSIQLRGLVAGGVQGQPIGDWGTALAPDSNSIFLGYSNTSTARIDVTNVGTVLVNGYSTGASNAWVSLENVNWFPKGS